jgi:hypothetical protein
MKKNLLVHFLVITNIVTAGLAFYAWFGRSIWKSEWQTAVTLDAQLAGKLYAGYMYDLGRIVRLRLAIEDKPHGYVDKPVEFDGPYAIQDWVCYTDPVYGGQDSPSIISGKALVEAFNTKMKEIRENPEKYESQKQKSIEYWRENVLNKRSPSSKPSSADSKASTLSSGK